MMELNVGGDGMTGWTTADEIDYVEGLGFHRGLDRVLPPAQFARHRVAMLSAYLGVMPLRVAWGAVDPERVRQRVLEMLLFEERELEESAA